ncbi:unnamed protein product, partial [marine sediment metagenome]
RRHKRYDSKSLSCYQRLLKKSFVLDDMRNCREFLDIMHLHGEFVNEYPRVAKDALVKFFEVSDTPKRALKRAALAEIKKGVNMGKFAKAATSMMRGGI